MPTPAAAGISVEEADRICDALEAPYPERIVRTVRAAMGASDDPSEQVRQIAQVVQEQGLHPSPAPEPLPEITEDDVHLVCWLAITPEPPDGLEALSDGSLPLDLPGQQRLGGPESSNRGLMFAVLPSLPKEEMCPRSTGTPATR